MLSCICWNLIRSGNQEPCRSLFWITLAVPLLSLDFMFSYRMEMLSSIYFVLTLQSPQLSTLRHFSDYSRAQRQGTKQRVVVSLHWENRDKSPGRPMGLKFDKHGMGGKGAFQSKSPINMPWGPLELCLKNNLYLQGVRIHEASQIILLGKKKEKPETVSWIITTIHIGLRDVQVMTNQNEKASVNTLDCQ